MHNDRTTESLLARRALAEKATPGPWKKGIALRQGYGVDAIWDCNDTLVADSEFSESPREESNIAHIAANSPDVVMADIDEILRLRAEVERLEKDADWLALVLANAGCGIPLTEYIGEAVNGMSPPAPEHWREAARKAAKVDCGDPLKLACYLLARACQRHHCANCFLPHKEKLCPRRANGGCVVLESASQTEWYTFLKEKSE